MVSGERVTAELLPVLGVSPALGPNFQPDEDRPGGNGRPSLLAGVVGIAGGATATRVLVAYGPTSVPRLDETSLDLSVFVFTLAGLRDDGGSQVRGRRMRRTVASKRRLDDLDIDRLGPAGMDLRRT